MKPEGPLPEPSGSLRPPVRLPPTAVGLATPPPPAPIPSSSRKRGESALMRLLRHLAMVPFDLADLLAAKLAGPRTPSPPTL